MDKNDRSEVLNSVYRGAEAGVTAINDLLPGVKNSSFRADLITQRTKYSAIKDSAEQQLCSLGLPPKDIPPLKKAGMTIGTQMNVAMNNDTGHLAELMIRGSTMGITNMTKVLNRYDGSDKNTVDLAQELITTEQQNIDRLKAYLK